MFSLIAESPAREVASMASVNCIRLLSAATAAALLLAASCAPVRAPVTGAQGSSAVDYSELKEAASPADAVVVGQVVDANFSAPNADKFLTTFHVQISDILRGTGREGEIVCVRYPLGQHANGQWDRVAHIVLVSPDAESRIGAGDRLLLFLSRRTYEQQAAARGGTALPGCTGTGPGMFRIEGSAIVPSSLFRTPNTVDELRAILKE